MGIRVGEKTIRFDMPPNIIGFSSVVGKDEKNGPYGACFDITFEDSLWGEKTYELAERKMQLKAVETAVEKSGLVPDDIHLLLGGDLLNQIISSGFVARQMGIPFVGLYGACSTMSESLLVGAMAVDGGFATHAVCTTSSHFATAERQFRNPLELGTPKTPTSQNTATAAGAVVLSAQRGQYPSVTTATPGRVVDMGVNDVNNMGAAMAPAAAETIISHLEDIGQRPEYFDAIITGDLGTFGSELLIKYASEVGWDLSGVHKDCGAMLYEGNEMMNCGGSGCGCSACMLNGYFLPELIKGNLKRILFVATGALHSPTSALQGETIPCIAHAIAIETGGSI
jgi:stage V sporulation protein AD